MAESGRLNFVCADDSEFSVNGFNWYVENHHRGEDTICLVHVHQMPSLPTIGLMAGGVPLTDEYHKSIERSKRIAQGIKEKFDAICKAKDLKCEFLLADAHHKPGHVICELAKEKNAASITMGQRGLGTISRALLGSTSDYVLHHSHVPVMVVPAKKKH